MKHPERPALPAPETITPEDRADLLDFARVVQDGWARAKAERESRRRQPTRPPSPPAGQVEQPPALPRDPLSKFARGRDTCASPGGLADRYVVHVPMVRTIGYSD
jgi:hypothetical protein